ncbi:MAG: alpha/beta fold hydrolase [Salinirussus sp.]
MTNADEPIEGRYRYLEIDGAEYRCYYEVAGDGPIPLVCLHTAGADSRQYRHQLCDSELGDLFTMYAFDMPWHGRTFPPLEQEWWWSEYRLTTAFYVECILAFVDALDLDDPVAMGCSMGGEIILTLAADHADRFRAVIGLETTDHIDLAESAYVDDMLGHFTDAAIDQETFRAEWSVGLHGPGADEHRVRETAWMYSQAGAGVYAGDLHFYAREFDARDTLDRIDTDACGVHLLTGEYDFSVRAADTRRVANRIDGATFQVMDGLGHYPPTENPSVFKEYLLDVAADIGA